MTIEKTQTSVVFQNVDAASAFPIPFPVLDKSNIAVTYQNRDGTRRAAVEGIDYRVAFEGNRLRRTKAAVLTLLVPPAKGATVLVSRRVPITQEIVFFNQGPYTPAAIEESLDKLTMICQELSEGLDALPLGDLARRQDELERSIADIGSRLAQTMPVSPEGGTYAASGDRWVPIDPRPADAGDPFVLDESGYVVAAVRAAYRPNPVWTIDSRNISLSPSARAGDADSRFVIDGDGYCVVKN